MFVTKCIVLLLGVYSTFAYPHEGKIIGGRDAMPEQFPFSVSFRLAGDHTCGATIINERYLLTAGVCMYKYDPEDIDVLVGTIYLNGTGGTFYKVESLLTHPDFDRDTLQNDLGIVKLAQSIPIDFDARPIELREEEVAGDEEVIAIGWGRRWQGQWGGDPLANTLQWLPMKTVDTQKCKELEAEWSEREVTENMLCAYSRYHEGTCNGDSGSPLLLRGKQVGMVSWARTCAKGYPDVFTRISSYIDWIKENTQL